MREYKRFVAKVDPELNEAYEEAARNEKAEALIAPSRSKLKRVLMRHGFLTAACLDCNAEVSKEMYRRLGVESVKVGVTLISPNLLDTPTVKEQIKRYGLENPPSPFLEQNMDAILGAVSNSSSKSKEEGKKE